MVRAIRISLLATVLPLACSAAQASAVCHPVHHRHITRVHKAVSHRVAGLGVVVDETRLISFAKPVKTVFVGNSTIADISMIDSQHAFLLGKTFGVTNMIALAADGQEISNRQVTVYNNGAAVTVNRGADQFDYMCTLAHCESAPRPGDNQGFVSTTESSATTHESQGNTAGAAPQGQQASN
ncbi:MAG: pilus assembly protein N-terminal domain-containing protein [Rhizomicrobium sp.]